MEKKKQSLWISFVRCHPSFPWVLSFIMHRGLSPLCFINRASPFLFCCTSGFSVYTVFCLFLLFYMSLHSFLKWFRTKIKVLLASIPMLCCHGSYTRMPGKCTIWIPAEDVQLANDIGLRRNAAPSSSHENNNMPNSKFPVTATQNFSYLNSEFWVAATQNLKLPQLKISSCLN